MTTDRLESVREKAAALPHEPGVYVFLDDRGAVLYVGKAIDLRKRVRGYFTGPPDGRMFFGRIRESTADIHFIVVSSEKEAFILENNLIKENRPPCNLVLRDDKTYPCLRLTVGEEFPRLHKVRKVFRDSARYFGPYSSGLSLNRMLEAMKRAFPLRVCTPAAFSSRKRPCIRFEVGVCSGPCCGKIGAAEYRAIVDDAALFLSGKSRELVAAMKKRMIEEAETLRFEEAARTRDAVLAIEGSLQKQEVVFHSMGDLDAFGLHREGDTLAIAVLFVRDGRVIGADSSLHRTDVSDADALQSAVMQFYSGEKIPPPEVLAPADPLCLAVVAEILCDRRGGTVRVVRPVRGPRRAVLEMAARNAAFAFAGKMPDDLAEAMAQVAVLLGLSSPPRTIECFDASHTAGTGMVGGLVAFEDGKPRKSGYRTFRIRDAAPGDDFAAISEMILRRFAPGKEPPPDLVLVDGGSPQLRAASAALLSRGVSSPLAGIAKDRNAGGGTARPDRILLPGSAEPVDVPADSPAMHLLQRIRDEAHRFAVGYHRKLRGAQTFKSGLEGVPGIGPSRRRALLKKFGGADAIAAASIDEISSVKGITKSMALSILDFLDSAAGDGGVNETDNGEKMDA